MKIKSKTCFILCLFCIVSLSVQAQETIASDGGYAITSGARVTWTIGETITETATGTNSILTQGFNQGDLIITAIRRSEIPGLMIRAYPNPANDHLRISAGEADIDNLNYILIDMSGKVLAKSRIPGTEHEIPLSGLSPSTYLVKVYLNNSEVAIFKIIKNK